jgi:hypothetical protein
MNVWDTIAEVEAILPGQAAREEEEFDPRWQAIIRMGDFIQGEPEAVWAFVLRWGSHEDEDLRTAVATVLLEHLLEHHFERFFPRVTTAVQSNVFFGDTFARCSKFGQAKQGANGNLFDDLRKSVLRA